jgi:predicted RND superfamily exporter protein
VGDGTKTSFFERFAELVLGHRLLALLFIVAVTAGMGLALPTLRSDNSLESFTANNDAQATLEEFRDEFGRDDLFLVLVEGDVFTKAYVDKLAALHHELAAVDIDIASLGHRRVSRQPAPAQPVAKASDEPSGDGPGDGEDDFGDFEEDDEVAGDDFGDFEDDEATEDDWGDEAGGTIMDEVVSLINARRTEGDGEGITVGKWMTPLPTEAQLPQLKSEILSDRNLVGRLVGERGQHSLITIRTQFMNEKDSIRVYDAVREIADRHSAAGFRVSVAGLPALAASLNRLMMRDLARLLVIALAVMVVILVVLFRHPIGVLGPVLVVCLAAVWTFGTMALVGIPMTVMTNILPVFVLCVGVGDSIHIQSVYRDHMRAGDASKDAVRKALATTGLPCALTTLTTMVGLLSFNFASVTSVRTMGTAAAIGTFYALVNSLVLLPVVLSFNRKSLLGVTKKKSADVLDRVLDACSRMSRPSGRRKVTVAVAAALAGGSIALGLLRVDVWHDPLAWMPRDDPTVRAFHGVDTHIGGTASVNLLIVPKGKRGMKDLELLRGLEKLDEDIRAYVHPEEGVIVGNSISLLDVVKETNRALHASKASEYKLPDTQRGVSDRLFVFENSGRDELRRLATANLDKSHLSYQMRWLEATSYAGLVTHIENAIEERIPKELAEVRPTGTIFLAASVVTNLIYDLLRSFGTAFLVIAAMMILLFGELKLGLIAMVPNLLPIVLIMGLMGAVAMPIDINNLLVGSVVIGLAVDDTIHFFHHFQSRYKQTGQVEDSIDHSMKHSGRALVSTSVVLAMGFLVYTSASMINLVRFGLLVSAAIVFALSSDILLGPALLRTFYRDKSPSPQGASDETNEPT